MFDTWFTNKCMALVDETGRALSGEALQAAEAALAEAKSKNCKLWTDRNGYFYKKERKMFAKPELLRDANGRPVRICGHLVKTRAKFCSRCGNPAPGGWWRCGGCGQHIGNESKTCPHCGHVQNNSMRLDLADGIWQKDEEIFAERFELSESASLLPKGLNVQESQRVILLEGGAVTGEVLAPGFYKTPDLHGPDGADRSLVMVDASEFDLGVCVDELRTNDNLEADLHTVITLAFDESNAVNFMKNLMGSSLYLRQDTLTSSLGYDEVAHCILQNVDASVREFCNLRTVSDLFKNADVRIELENFVESRVRHNLSSIGLKFVRLKEVEFESPVFDRLRKISGQVEAKRREIEFMKRADELANDATRREAMNDFEMEEYMNQLSQEKGIKDELRVQELERVKIIWSRRKVHEEAVQREDDADLAHGRDLARKMQTAEHDEGVRDLQHDHELARKMKLAEHEETVRNLQHKEELERRMREQTTSLDFMKVEQEIQLIKLEIAKAKAAADLEIENKKAAAEQEQTREWIKIKQDEERFKQQQKLEIIEKTKGADMQALLMAEDDAAKRKDLLLLNEQEMQSKMTPESLLAAAAARGNTAAADALSHVNREQLASVERSKEQNSELYERMLAMNERMFKDAVESFSKQSSGSGTTTQIIK